MHSLSASTIGLSLLFHLQEVKVIDLFVERGTPPCETMHVLICVFDGRTILVPSFSAGQWYNKTAIRRLAKLLAVEV